MKKLGCAGIIAGAIVAVLLIVFFFTPVGTVMKLAYKQEALKRRADLPEIAREMASFLSDDPPRTLRATDPDYPPRLKKLGALRMQTSVNHVYLEFGGGFYHYGYLVERSDPDNPKALKLICYGEEEEDRDVLLVFESQAETE